MPTEPSSAATDPSGTKTDGGPTTPACDQCRSRKIRCNRERPECLNCRKAGLACDFSNRGKRVNHTRQLVDDFSSLGAHLESIDNSIAQISRQFSSAEHKSLAASPTPESDGVDHFYTRRRLENSEPDTLAAPKGDISRAVHQKFDDRGGERYYGSTAALSLIESSWRVLGEILGNAQAKKGGPVTKLADKDASFRAELQNLHNSFPFLNSCQEPDYGADGQAVSSPPRSFINTVVDCFLTNVNQIRPIFQESRLRAAIEQDDSPNGSELTEARTLCFSNIILLSLCLKSRLARCNHSNGNGMDDDLELSFLKNSRRAIGHLDSYLEPRLINVQALATLAMVAREYWENQVFERLCHMACLVAKSMGLQQRPRSPNGKMSEEDAERTQLFWALYVMDKERTFMTGQPCDFYFFDTDMQLLEGKSGCSLQHYTVAHYHMMSLWEEVYISLYSSGAMRKDLSHRSNQVSRLSTLFRSWGCKYKELLNASLVTEDPTRDSFQTELKYCFHVGQILIHHWGNEEGNKQQRTNSVYAALNIIKDVHGAPPGLSRIALLGRLFRCYPSIPFLDLYTQILEEPNGRVASDVQLLIITAEAVSLLKDLKFSRAYYSRLHIGMLWCIKVASTVAKCVGQSLTATHQPLAAPPEAPAPNYLQRSKPPPLSVDSSSSSSKVAHTSSLDDSPRPRKRPSPPQNTHKMDVHIRTMPDAQEPMMGTSLPITNQNTNGGAHSGLPGEEDPAAPASAMLLAPHHSEFQDWRMTTFNHEHELNFINLPTSSGPGEIFYEAGTFDNFMPMVGDVTEPWEMDFTNQVMLDGKAFDDWSNLRQ